MEGKVTQDPIFQKVCSIERLVLATEMNATQENEEDGSLEPALDSWY